MTKEIDKEDDIEIDETNEDAAYWKELALKQQGINKRNKTKLEKIQNEFDEFKSANPPKKDTPPEKPEKPSGLDYGNLAFYNSKDGVSKIQHEDDIKFLEDQIKETGKSQDYILNSGWFQSEIKSKQVARAAQAAVPTEGRRGEPASSKDKVDYWLNLNQAPPADQPELLREYVAKKFEREKSAYSKPPMNEKISGTNLDIR